MLLERRASTAVGRVGLIRNPRSRRNRRNGEPWWREFGDPDLLRAEPETPEELVSALRDFARREVRLLVVDGGDGTIREVLTALPDAFGAAPPALAVLASGTTNLIAADVGAGRPDSATVAMLCQIARSGAANVQRRPVLEVSWPDGSRRPVRGMFLGAAAFTRGIDLSMRLVRQGKIDEGAGIAATLLSAVAQTIAGPERDRWLNGDRMIVAPGGLAASSGPRFLFMATTLRKLMLGLWPFWGDGEGELRYLDIDAPPRRLATALPAVMRGRPRPWMPAAGYRSGAVRALDLSLTEPFVVDGEHFEPGPGGAVRIRTGQTLDFIVP